MRKCQGLVDSLVSYVKDCVEAGKPDDKVSHTVYLYKTNPIECVCQMSVMWNVNRKKSLLLLYRDSLFKVSQSLVLCSSVDLQQPNVAV